ncbi:hypothetical protein NIES4102_11640 [Chondrocystis sp. NIES-4102]|nr:hypothetical protein NIES4102_11640 [Chondrocystis sp. NIES-4102]
MQSIYKYTQMSNLPLWNKQYMAIAIMFFHRLRPITPSLGLKTPHTFYLSLLILSFLMSKTLAMASTPQKAQQYPADFVENYNLECLQTSQGQGLDEIQARKLCNCTLNKFQEQYSLTEFKQLMGAGVNNQQGRNDLIKIGKVCLEQVVD